MRVHGRNGAATWAPATGGYCWRAARSTAAMISPRASRGGSGINPESSMWRRAGCFSMALAHGLTSSNTRRTASRDRGSAHRKKKGAFAIPLIELETEGDVPGIDDQTFGSRHKPRRTGARCRRRSPAGKSNSSAPAWLQAKPFSRLRACKIFRTAMGCLNTAVPRCVRGFPYLTAGVDKSAT